MRKRILNENISKLNLDSNIIQVLNENNINLVEDLWARNREFLKKMNLTNTEINKIIISLELEGLGLNKKEY